MNGATDILVAEAVLAEINLAPAATFCLAFTAERLYIGTPDLADLAGILLSVTPGAVDDSFTARDKVSEEVKISVGIRKKIVAAPADIFVYNAELDNLRFLTSQVKKYFEAPSRRALRTMPGAVLQVGADNTPAYVPEHLAQLNQYTSIITLTYRVASALAGG